MRMVVSAFICLFLTCMTPSVFASPAEWTAVRATGQVRYTLDKSTWISLSKGMTVPNHAWISTGPRGRLQLTRGTESIAFQPETVALITTRGSGGMRKTEIVQQIGEISLKIEKRLVPHTTVQTPFLAAVVKGTRFTVKVGKVNAAVAVDRGLVQVTSFRSGQRSDLGAGQRARVNAAGMSVAGISHKPAITRVTRPAVPVRSLKDVPSPKNDDVHGKKADKSSAKHTDKAPGKNKSASNDKSSANHSGKGHAGGSKGRDGGRDGGKSDSNGGSAGRGGNSGGKGNGGSKGGDGGGKGKGKH